MAERTEPIGVIGTGYVGLVTAVGFASRGVDVFCVDADEAKIERLCQADVPFYEPKLQDLVRTHRERLHFSTAYRDALENARLLFVAVGTPPMEIGAGVDLRQVQAVVDAIPAGSRRALVMKSTVPAGTGESIKRLLAGRDKKHVAYVSCPEFLKEGSAVHDVQHPDRVVVGDDGDWAGDAVVALYEPLCTALDVPLVRMDITSAEMVKLASNAFLATKISFINEIANVCDRVGADVLNVVRGMGPDPRIGDQFLKAGIGYGGSCFAKDVEALRHLAQQHEYKFLLLSAGAEVNDGQKRRVVEKLTAHFDGSIAGRSICLLGLAFKPDTDDMRDAASLVVSETLQTAGAKVTVYDPRVHGGLATDLGSARVARDALDAVTGADAVVLVTEWQEFVELDWATVAERMAGTFVLDGRNALDAHAVRAAGLIYEGIGRGTRVVPSHAPNHPPTAPRL